MKKNLLFDDNKLESYVKANVDKYRKDEIKSIWDRL